MNPSNGALLLGGALLILSFIFGKLSVKTKIPSVLWLIATGILLRLQADSVRFVLPYQRSGVEILGTLGLLFVVLEGSLDLEITRQKRRLILQSSAAAILGVLATLLAVAYPATLLLNISWRDALVNAAPLAVISSAIAIPSAISLSPRLREFVVYESSLSDIVGVLLFGMLIATEPLSLSSVAGLLLAVAGTLAVGLGCAAATILLFKYVEGATRSVFVYAVLVVLYGLGKLLHFPSLLIIFSFGIAIRNPSLIFRRLLGQYRENADIAGVSEKLHELTAEVAFVVRTFFFVLFGYTIELHYLLTYESILSAFVVVPCILFCRWIVLRLIGSDYWRRLTFFAPRGLISVILFFSIPRELRHPDVTQGVLLTVIMFTNLLMIVDLTRSGHQKIVTAASEDRR